MKKPPLQRTRGGGKKTFGLSGMRKVHRALNASSRRQLPVRPALDAHIPILQILDLAAGLLLSIADSPILTGIVLFRKAPLLYNGYAKKVYSFYLEIVQNNLKKENGSDKTSKEKRIRKWTGLLK